MTASTIQPEICLEGATLADTYEGQRHRQNCRRRSTYGNGSLLRNDFPWRTRLRHANVSLAIADFGLQTFIFGRDVVSKILQLSLIEVWWLPLIVMIHLHSIVYIVHDSFAPQRKATNLDNFLPILNGGSASTSVLIEKLLVNTTHTFSCHFLFWSLAFWKFCWIDDWEAEFSDWP